MRRLKAVSTNSRVTWENLHRYAVLNSLDQAWLERKCAKTDNAVQDLAEYVLQWKYPNGEFSK